MHFSRFFFLWLLGLMATVYSQVPEISPELEASQGDILDFPLLREVERRKELLEQEKFQQKRQEQFDELKQLLRQARQRNDPDAKILHYLRALELINTMWAEQEDVRLKRLDAMTRKSILAVPPPQFFIDSSGLEMILIDAEPEPFYISRTPIQPNQFSVFKSSAEYLAISASDKAISATEELPPIEEALNRSLLDGTVVTGVDWYTAASFCTWLTSFSRLPYQLPTVAQLQQLEGEQMWAVWTRDQWKGMDAQEEQVRGRFGVQMYLVWESKQSAGVSAFGELPFAKHPDLGFMVVSDWRSGVKHRLARLKTQL